MKGILYISAAAVMLSGCNVFDNEIQVKDMGFEVKSEVVWNADYLAYTLNLTLLEGEGGEYTMDYLFDEDHTLKLRSLDSDDIDSGSEVEMTRGNAVSFLLPPLGTGIEHSVSIVLTRNGVSRSCSVKLPDTSQNAVGIRMDTSSSLDFSRVILTNLMGASVTTYTVSFSLDGQALDGIKYMSNTFGGSMEIDFARSESYTFELPYIVSGQHILTVNIKSSQGTQDSSIAFTEPQRRQTSLHLAYNPYTGRMTMSSDYNPIGTEFDIAVGISVYGMVTYRHKQWIGVAKEKTEHFSDTGEASVTIKPGITETDIDNGAVKAVMDRIFSNTRTDAANFIGNGNARTVHADIISVDLKFTIHSRGDYAGKTVVTLSPPDGKGLPIRYRYTGETWMHPAGYTTTVTPTVSVNGCDPSDVHIL